MFFLKKKTKHAFSHIEFPEVERCISFVLGERDKFHFIYLPSALHLPSFSSGATSRERICEGPWMRVMTCGPRVSLEGRAVGGG